MTEYANTLEHFPLVPSPDSIHVSTGVKKSTNSKCFAILRVSLILLFTLVAMLSSFQSRYASSTNVDGDEQIKQYEQEFSLEGIDFDGDEQIKQYEQEFSLEDIDFDAPAPCGRHKCFFQLKDDSVGYLAAEVGAKSVDNDQEESAQSYSQVMDIGYQLAKYLEGEYAIRHFLLAPPHEIAISQPLGEKFNANLYHPGTGKRNKQWADRFLNQSSLVVQKVDVAPSPSAFIRNHPNTQKWIYDGFDDFFRTSVQHKARFVKQFRKELNKAAKLVAKEPFYAKDFQALVDTSGRLYHIDFDVFKKQNKVPDSIEELRRTSLQDLDKSGMSIEEWTRLATESFGKFLQHAESSVAVNLR